ncbi:MAG: gliding motility-associated C-terminal domain-containing protein [Cyclobacteriaceae bacterium]|nr:gliding motility-associated C-terminal domain-containing protein [Cyclobacteriaceae bacterium]
MGKKIALVCGALLWVSAIYAQPYVSAKGRFQVDEIKGCAPFTITLTNLLAGNCNAGNPCNMDYENNGQQVTNVFTYTYTNPGTYKLKVLYQGQGDDEITITVVQNIEPAFEIYSCANSDVTIKVLEKSYQQLVIDFTNDGIPEIVIPSGNNATAFHDYATPGNKTITVRGRNLNSADNCDSKVETFNALPTLPAPSYNSLEVLDAAQIELDFNTQEHIQYRQEIAVNQSSNFQLLNTLYEQNTVTVPNLTPEQNFYCFRLGAFDVCNNNSTYAPIICSVDLNLDFQSGVNNVNWSTSGVGVSSTTIERNGQALTNIPGSPSTFADDINFECKKEYCYRVINQYGGGVTSSSLQYCDISFQINNPSAIVNTSAVVSDQGVRLEWVEPGATPPSYSVLRSFGELPFSAIGSSSSNTFLDVNYTTADQYSYRVDYTDECDNNSPEGLVVIPVRLEGNIDNNVVTIIWSEFEGWQNGINNYVIEKLDQSGNIFATIDAGIDKSFVDDIPDPDHQLVRYRIRANAAQSGLSLSRSNTLTFVKDSKLFSPTAFTPNSDKLNDTFVVSGQFIVKLEVTIFNRWGELMFATDKKNEPWDGTFNGKPAPEDAYIWSAQVTDLAGRSYKASGTVALLRKKK